MADAVLAINAGSSSIKFGVFQIRRDGAPIAVARGAVEGIGSSPHFIARDGQGVTIAEQRWDDGAHGDHAAMLDGLLKWIDAHLGQDALVAVGHRVVHGGSAFTAPLRIDADTLTALEKLTPLAPLHQPHSLSPMRAIAAIRPTLPQIACFDTAFHRTLPPVATRLALPRDYDRQGVRRYGFHGLSYEYIARALRETAPELVAGKVVVAHLGNGASLCAMANTRSVETTMGFTALDGLVMGTRCGAIDPGVILYMLQEQKLDAAAVEDILYRRSGLLGVSGLSSDMRTLLETDSAPAREAVALFVYRIAGEVAALAAALGGLDGIVFTAGIGEHAPEIRQAVCERLAWLGVAVDADANAQHAGRIATADSRVDVRVMPTDEEIMIARHTIETLSAPERQTPATAAAGTR